MEKELNILSRLPEVLMKWFSENRRELPWRKTKEPYHIWLSEIMLQQTRVEAVKGYYTRFLEMLPTVQALADADEELLAKLWEGLGYYSRMRNLQKAARIIVGEYGGEFPRNFEKILALPGVGPYTAGAVCSIAFDIPVPAVDGNVLRVYSRLTDDDTPIDKLKEKAAQELAEIYPDRAGDFTQALMELGATICGPDKKPDCDNCPCKAFCLGCQKGTAASLPVRPPKKERRQEHKTVFILCCGDLYALQKRPHKGLLAGLWQFPNTEGHLDAAQAVAALEQMGLAVTDILGQVERKHIFTHVQWNMRGFYACVREPVGDFCWMTKEEITGQVALPTAFRQFWEENFF